MLTYKTIPSLFENLSKYDPFPPEVKATIENHRDILCVEYCNKDEHSVLIPKDTWQPLLVTTIGKTQTISDKTGNLAIVHSCLSALFIKTEPHTWEYFQVGLSEKEPYAWFSGLYYKIYAPYKIGAHIEVRGHVLEDDVLKVMGQAYALMGLRVGALLENAVVNTNTILQL